MSPEENPTAPSTPTTEPNFQPMPTPPSAPVRQPVMPNLNGEPTSEAPNPAAKPQMDAKKCKTFIILGSVVGVIMLALIGLLVWFFAFYSRPDKVAFDALARVIQSPELSLAGSVQYQSSADYPAMGIKSLDYNFDLASSTLPNSTNNTLKITFDDDDESDPSLTLGLNARIDDNGVIYAQLTNLSESIRNLLNTQQLQEGEGLDEQYERMYDRITQSIQLVESIEADWWRIDIDEITADFYDESEPEAIMYREFYACAVNNIKDSAQRAKVSQELLAHYQAHPFLVVKKDNDGGTTATGAKAANGYDYYRVEFDYDQMADFLNGLPELSETNQLKNCYVEAHDRYAEALGYVDYENDVEDEDFTYETISAEDLSEAYGNDFALYLEISTFGHQLRSVLLSVEDDASLKTYLIPSYTANPTEIPADSRPISELYEGLMDYFYGGITYSPFLTEAYGDNDVDLDYEYYSNDETWSV